jgi:hypothetical protein
MNMLKADQQPTRAACDSNSLLRLVLVFAIAVAVGITITTSSTAQDHKDPWEQPPHPLSQDRAKESSTSSTSGKPEKSDAQKVKKRAKSGKESKAGQPSLPTAPAVVDEPEKPARQPVVTIAPGELDLTTSDWGKTLVVEIKNTRAEMTAYSVWVKLKAQAPGVRIDDVDILSEAGQEFISESFSGVNANFEVMMFRALDADRQPCKYLLIYRLKGLESKFVKIKRKASTDAEKKPLTLLLSLSGFSEKPSPIAAKDGAVALQFAPPESMTVEAISVLMKKDP